MNGCPTTTKGFYWICTLNNPTPEERNLLKAPPMYIVEEWYQDEIGTTTGTLHIQLALRTTEVRKSQILKDFPRMWVDKARNKMACINYVQKSDGTQVPGTFVHWTSNEIIDEENQDKALSQQQILELLAHWVHEDDYSSASEVQYRNAINSIIEVRPELISQLTGTRIGPVWNLTNSTWLYKVQKFIATCHSEGPDSQTDYYEIFPECDCAKDNCQDCSFWENY